MNLQQNIHLVDCDTLRFGQKEECPEGSCEHPACEKEPNTIIETTEDVRKSFCDNELDQPLVESGKGSSQIAESTRKDLCGDDPWDTIQTERPAVLVSITILSHLQASNSQH